MLTKKQAKAEIARRKANRKGDVRQEPTSVEAFTATNRDLRLLAGGKPSRTRSITKTAPNGTKPKGTAPVKGVSTLGLTADQVTKRAAVIAAMESEGLPIKGAEYHARMAAAGVPTRRSAPFTVRVTV